MGEQRGADCWCQHHVNHLSSINSDFDNKARSGRLMENKSSKALIWFTRSRSELYLCSINQISKWIRTASSVRCSCPATRYCFNIITADSKNSSVCDRTGYFLFHRKSLLCIQSPSRGRRKHTRLRRGTTLSHNVIHLKTDLEGECFSITQGWPNIRASGRDDFGEGERMTA